MAPPTETTALLPGDGDGDDEQSTTRSEAAAAAAHRHRRLVLSIVLTSVVAADFGNALSLAPQLKLYESLICGRLFGRVAADGDDLICKSPQVQSELALLIGWKETFDQIPGIALVLLYGWAADLIGRKPCSAEADASNGDDDDGDDDFGTAIPLLAKCILKAENQLEVQLYFDTEILHPELVEHMLHQFQLIVHQLGHDYDHLQKLQLGGLNTVSDHSKALIQSWNLKLPNKVHDWIPNLFSHQVLANPQRTAVHAWDGRLSYAELDYKSTILGKWLLLNKVAGSRLVLPICFDKTFWTTIALLAAAKIGATFIMIDPYQPRGRLASILSKFDYSGMLARADTFELARSLTSKPVHIVNDELLAQGVQSNAELYQELYPGSPEDPLYIVFTSGSTGEPKGIKISHSNLCSAVSHQARTLGFAGSRSFDSSSYSFDAYVCNTFHTLLTGGCLCVPSEYERINNLEAVLRQMKVDLVQLTPSTCSVLDPASLPLLRTLILTGEKMTQSVLDPWLSTKRVRVINAYGPSECTI
ncbi:hypothetical protein MY10362_007024, partial [Beauveria mimosiformis]